MTTTQAAVLEFEISADDGTVESGSLGAGETSLSGRFRINTQVPDADEETTFGPVPGALPGRSFLTSFTIEPRVLSGDVAVDGLDGPFEISESSAFAGATAGPTSVLEHSTAVTGEASLANTTDHNLLGGFRRDRFEAASDPWAQFYLERDQFFSSDLAFRSGGTVINYADARWSVERVGASPSVPAPAPLTLLGLGVGAFWLGGKRSRDRALMGASSPHAR